MKVHSRLEQLVTLNAIGDLQHDLEVVAEAGNLAQARQRFSRRLGPASDG